MSRRPRLARDRADSRHSTNVVPLIRWGSCLADVVYAVVGTRHDSAYMSRCPGSTKGIFSWFPRDRYTPYDHANKHSRTRDDTVLVLPSISDDAGHSRRTADVRGERGATDRRCEGKKERQSTLDDDWLVRLTQSRIVAARRRR